MHQTRNTLSVVLSLIVCVALSAVVPRVFQINTNALAQTQDGGQTGANAADPVFHEYKGVGLGMKADEARKKLGKPTEKDDEQDFYIFSETESAQVYYDKAKTVIAVSVNFVGEGSSVPKPKAVLGTDVQAKPDGSMHHLVRFPKAGYWVSYSKSGGASPIITITVKKID